MTTPNQIQTKPITAERTLEDRFGKGKYFAIQCEVFKDCQRLFGVTDEHAEKLAKAIATNLGAIFANGQVTIKGLDRVNKDGKLASVSEITKVKGLPLTNEVSLLRAINYCNSATVNHVKGVFALQGETSKWVDSLK